VRITDTTPIEDGYYMPAEYDRHKATIMIWPVRTGSWPYNAVAAQNVFVDIAHIISRHEKVYILADEKHYAQAEARSYISCPRIICFDADYFNIPGSFNIFTGFITFSCS